MHKITPCIWMDNEAEEAANFYISVFPNSKITGIERYLTETPSNKPIGSVLTVTFELDGMEFMTLNGGSDFKPTEAVSFIIPCDTQEELDYYYDKLSNEPEAEVCGWIKDKFGVSWQIVPKQLNDIMSNTDEERKKRVMQSLLKMKRLNIQDLVNAAS